MSTSIFSSKFSESRMNRITIESPGRRMAPIPGAVSGFGHSIATCLLLVLVGAGLAELPASASPKLDFLVYEASVQEELIADLEGHQVGVYGDTLVLGAPSESIYSEDRESGASVFERSDGEWNFVKLLNFGGESDSLNSYAGDTVAIHEQTIAVGSPLTRRVLIATRIDGEWVEQARLSSEDELFGDALALHGDTLVVGSRSAGSATVFVRTEGEWTQQDYLVTNTRNREEGIAIHEDTLVIMDNSPDLGAAFVFVREGASWTQVQRLTATDDPAGNMSRRSVSIHGNAIAVGDVSTAGPEGRIYLYRRQGDTWEFETKITSPNVAGRPWFGRHVVLHEDALFTGSTEDNEAGTAAGAAYLFSRDSGAWTLRSQLLASDPSPQARFGTHVAFDGTTAAVASHWNNRPPVDVFRVTPTARVPRIRALLYYPDAVTFPGGDPDAAAFRYRQLLFQEDDDGIRPRPEQMSGIYGAAERERALEAESVLLNSIVLFPDNPELAQLLLDLYYDRTVAEAILVRELAQAAERARFGPPLAPPAAANGFLIDLEIPRYRELVEVNAGVLEGHLKLLDDDLGVPGDPPLGYELFRTLVPQRALESATYRDVNGDDVPVGADPVLFDGYKDLVLLFDLLRDQGRYAENLASLLIGRDQGADRDEVAEVLAQAQRLVVLEGIMLERMFDDLPPAGDASGLREAIDGWRESVHGLIRLEQFLLGDANLLGFTDDFMMFVQKFSGQQEVFDSYDALKVRLNPDLTSNPLGFGLQQLQRARDSYADYRGFQSELAAQFDQSSITYVDRLRDIVGVFPDDPNYSDDPTANPGSELDQQYRSIELARLQIERNRTEIDNLNEQISIELRKAESISDVLIDFGSQQAELTRVIGHWNAAQGASSALADGLSVDKLTKGLAAGFIVNAAVQGIAEEFKAKAEAEKEELAALEQATIVGIESDATVKTLALSFKTLAIDSQQTAILLQQELNRLVALYREKADLEQRVAEHRRSIAGRYFADPVHRLRQRSEMIEAGFAFEEARKWLHFMVRALEYKWNTPFAGFEYPTGSGRHWSAASLFKLRNADELQQMYLAMESFDGQIQLPTANYFDWFSVRDDFFGYKLTNRVGEIQVYADPISGEPVGAIEAFRSRLRQLQDGSGNIRLRFSTVRDVPGGTFFRGPRFSSAGQLESKGLFLDKIRWIQINLPGSHTLGRSQLTGELTYGGTSFIRNFDVGTPDPERPDRLRNELTAYSNRFWFFHAPSATWRSSEALSSPVSMQLNLDPRTPPTVQEIEIFKERSVAASGWVLAIPTRDLGETVLDIDELDDVELLFFHYAVTRP
jgi:hypothetical protein